MANSRICSVSDCGKPHEAKGLCNKHYLRLRTHGDALVSKFNRAANGEPQAYYEQVVLQYDGDDCLEWPFVRDNNGYGQMRRDGKLGRVTRFVCQDTYGPPPTPKHHAAHSCGKGHLGCTSKRHLEWKPPTENEADKLSHGTHNRGERHYGAKLTEAQAYEILSQKGKESQRSIASRYGISRGAVTDIHRGRSWGWL